MTQSKKNLIELYFGFPEIDKRPIRRNIRFEEEETGGW